MGLLIQTWFLRVFKWERDYWKSENGRGLLESYDTSALDRVPPSMIKWRQGILDDANPISTWISQNVVVTGGTSDYVLLSSLAELHGGSEGTRTTFGRLAKAYFDGIPGATFTAKTNIKQASTGLFKSERNVFRGIKLIKGCVPNATVSLISHLNCRN
jgi:hypothetical protein